ncbi:MAG: phosphoglycerate dehydrogenase [SAR324 cluster bacterium]|nr:phosphoglycerate dehydrogenase [SAR324 cluster bacterium]
MYQVLITGAIHPTGLDALGRESDLQIDYRPDCPFEQVMDIIEHYHCIISRSETPITRELIDRGTNLKVIARAAVGIGNIDVEYATEKGILVINTPGKNTNSAAELTVALLLATTRNVIPAHENMQQLKWDRHRFNGTELMGKTIGIVGLGNVGHRVAQFARGFDMKVLAYDPYIADEVFERHHVQKTDWETLISTADIISVHTPKNKETTGMISGNSISKMKQGVILLNLARGGIIDETALLDGLRSGHVSAAGIDTWDVEPPKKNPFREFPQVVMTPHIGASTTEAQIRIAESMASQVPRALRGEVVDYPVNMPQIRMLQGNLMTAYTVLAEKLGSFAAQSVDFAPTLLEMKYRGTLAKEDCSLLKLAFLKGYLKHSHDYVSYVNAEQRAESVGLRIEEEPDTGFTDYESALKCTLSCQEHVFKIGGVVFSGPHPRITLVNDFVFEINPEGTILVTSNLDRPGMIGLIGTFLGQHNININQFELSRSRRGGEAMALILVDEDVPESLVQELSRQTNMTGVKKITL